jgi:hypothetical protein
MPLYRKPGEELMPDISYKDASPKVIQLHHHQYLDPLNHQGRSTILKVKTLTVAWVNNPTATNGLVVLKAI